jgi:signal transduction histidine kinase
MSSIATLQREASAKEVSAPVEGLASVVHELRQPLSNIEAIAYYLSMVLPPGDEKIQAHLARIRELVQESNEILSSSVRAAALPSPRPADPAMTEGSGDGMLP